MSCLSCLGKQRKGALCCSCCDTCELLCLLSAPNEILCVDEEQRILNVDSLMVGMGKDELLAGAAPQWKTLLCFLCILESRDLDAFLVLARV